MIKALENFTYQLEGSPVQVYQGAIYSFPAYDEAFLISEGRAEMFYAESGSNLVGEAIVGSSVLKVGAPCIINMTEKDETDVYTFEIDKTLDEILTAFHSGSTVKLISGESVGDLILIRDDSRSGVTFLLHNGYEYEEGDENVHVFNEYVSIFKENGEDETKIEVVPFMVEAPYGD